MKNTVKYVPDTCPSCYKPIVWQGVHLVCANPACVAKQTYHVEHFIRTMEIETISATTLLKLNVRTIEDLYDLTEDIIMDTEGFGYKRASEIMDQLTKSLTTRPHKLLAAFGMPLVGRTASKAITSRYAFDQLFHLTESDDLGLGPTISKSFVDNICTFEDTYHYLVAKGLKFTEEKKSMISGKVFAMTGAGPLGRKELTEMIEDRGGSVKSVSKDTDYLACEDVGGNSSKLQKARKYGTKIISYDELMEMMD